ncbi:hypothetical protein AGMMS49949_02170 [Alphaproteobacteria bacterium]|nr:hypothetical protein AGMMS49949_02170 [Alphaproteobacteria bacterium]GHS96115.1 hypothetical protein AGMMS50296_1930 [Alphaproteobacteria bacterium]
MVDFGVLAALRQWMGQEGVGSEYGLTLENVFVMTPTAVPQKWPSIILELEEVWNQKVRLKTEGGRVVFKIIIFGNSEDGSEVIDIANCLQQLLDGISFSLPPSYEVTFRMNSSVLDFKKVINSPRKVEQRCEAFVRKRQTAAKNK